MKDRVDAIDRILWELPFTRGSEIGRGKTGTVYRGWTADGDVFHTTSLNPRARVVVKIVEMTECVVWGLLQYMSDGTVQLLKTASTHGTLRKFYRKNIRPIIASDPLEKTTINAPEMVVTAAASSNNIDSRIDAPPMGFDKEDCMIVQCNDFETEASFQSSVYMHEALMNNIITKAIVRRGICANFVEYLGSARTHTHGGHMFEYMHVDLKHYLRVLHRKHIRALVAQIAFALHCGQTLVGLKHHDLHSENIFCQLLEAPKGDSSRDFPPLTYNGSKGLHTYSKLTYIFEDGTVMTLPNIGVLAKIGDFGIAAATDPQSHKRVYRIDMDSFNGADRPTLHLSGHYNEILEGNEGYDIQTLLAHMMGQDVHAEVMDSIVTMNATILGATARTSERGRPYASFTSRVTPKEFLMTCPEFREFFVPDPTVVDSECAILGDLTKL